MADKVSIITVTYNNEEVIDKYLQSVSKLKGVEVVIVDNNSTDKTVEIIEKYNGVKLIQNKGNLGFAKSSNQGAKEASGEILLFLNPDTEIEEGGVEKLASFLVENKEVGVVVPALVEPSGELQPSVRNLPTVWRAIEEYYFDKKNAYRPFVPNGEGAIQVESAVGAALMIRKDLFNRIGGFDERYFMYFEDLQLCKDVSSLGYKIFYISSVRFKHKIGGSISEKKREWSKDSAKIYHGTLGVFMLNYLIRLRNYFSKEGSKRDG